MDLARSVYSGDLKIAAMRALDTGLPPVKLRGKYQLRPKLLERWRGEWRARGESAFPGIGVAVCFKHYADFLCHSRCNRAAISARHKPLASSNAFFPIRWYAPGASVWQSRHRGTHE